MAFVILVLMAFFAMIALQQQMTKKGVEAGSKDSEIKMILSYYKILREHQNETKANAFVIGYAQKCSGKSLRDDPDALWKELLGKGLMDWRAISILSTLWRSVSTPASP